MSSVRTRQIGNLKGLHHIADLLRRMEHDAWSVLVELEGPEGADPGSNGPRLASLFDLLYGKYGAHLGGRKNKVAVRLTLNQDMSVTSAEAAALQGREIVCGAMRLVGLDFWTVSSVRARPAGELEVEGRRYS